MENILITGLIFVAMYQLSSRMEIRPIVSAVIVALLPLFYTIVIRLIAQTGGGPFQLTDILIAVLQFITAFFIFSKLEYEESQSLWIAYLAIGLILTAIAIPTLITLFVHF